MRLKETSQASASFALPAAPPPAPATADLDLVPAGETWKLLDRLIEDGYAEAELARRLGSSTPALQISRTEVTVRTAREVRALSQRLKMCDAVPTLRFLANLREEGFRQSAIDARLAELATELGQEKPDLVGRGGRIREDAAALIRILHERMTS